MRASKHMPRQEFFFRQVVPLFIAFLGVSSLFFCVFFFFKALETNAVSGVISALYGGTTIVSTWALFEALKHRLFINESTIEFVGARSTKVMEVKEIDCLFWGIGRLGQGVIHLRANGRWTKIDLALYRRLDQCQIVNALSKRIPESRQSGWADFLSAARKPRVFRARLYPAEKRKGRKREEKEKREREKRERGKEGKGHA